MNDSFRMNARTVCGMAGAMLALLLLLDIQSLHQAAPQTPAPGVPNITVQERVVTREFNLVDGDGQTRVRLGMNELNAPALSLNDRTGQERALLRLNQNDVPSLRLFDNNGTMREGLGFTQGTLTPRLWFFDANGGTQQLLPGSDANRVNLSFDRMNSFPDFADYFRIHGLLNSHIDSYTTYAADSTGQLVNIQNVRAVGGDVYTTANPPLTANTGSVVIRWNDKTVPGSSAPVFVHVK